MVTQYRGILASFMLKVVLLFCAATFGVCASAQAADNRACTLLTRAEVEAGIGLKVLDLKPGNAPGSLPNPGTGDLCSGTAPTATILLRLAKKSGASGSESKGIAIAKQMGAQVEVKTFGAVTCSSMIPPKSLEQYGFNTTCSVQKGSQVAAIEVTAKTQNDMVSIGKLHPLAEKMTGRF